MGTTAKRLLVAVAFMLLVSLPAMFSAPAQAIETKSPYERSVWAVTDCDGSYKASSDTSTFHWNFDYNKQGQVTESYMSTQYFGNVVGSYRYDRTWSADGLSYQDTVESFSGHNGEVHNTASGGGTYKVDYQGLEAAFKAPGDHARFTLKYREDGTLERKVVKGADSANSVETYEYNDRGELVRYELESNDEDLWNEEGTYDISYEGDVPTSVVVSWSYSANSENVSAPEPETYELALITDDDGNVIEAQRDGMTVASFEWTQVKHPDPLARLVIQGQLASVFEVL